MEIRIKENRLKAGGIYVVVDPQQEEKLLLQRLKIIVEKGVSAVQIWDHFKDDQNVEELVAKIQRLCLPRQLPLLINNRWEDVPKLGLDGVHFDQIPQDLTTIKSKVGDQAIIGLTCGNAMESIEWAAQNKIDYISFCSLFPSKSAGACELVSHKVIKEARKRYKGTLYLAGGIAPDNLTTLSDLAFDGIAVISGLMDAKHPDRALEAYNSNLHSIL